MRHSPSKVKSNVKSFVAKYARHARIPSRKVYIGDNNVKILSRAPNTRGPTLSQIYARPISMAKKM